MFDRSTLNKRDWFHIVRQIIAGCLLLFKGIFMLLSWLIDKCIPGGFNERKTQSERNSLPATQGRSSRARIAGAQVRDGYITPTYKTGHAGTLATPYRLPGNKGGYREYIERKLVEVY